MLIVIPGIFVVVLSVLCWRRFSPRFSLPEELQDTAVATTFNNELTRFTGSHGWFRTDAAVSDLARQSAVSERLSAIREVYFPEMRFYWISLRTTHVAWLKSVSAPYSKLVMAVDPQSNRVWSFQNGRIERDLTPFLKAISFSIQQESDVVTLWQLYLCLHPAPDIECDVHRTQEGKWIVFSKDPKWPLFEVALIVELDSEHHVQSIQTLNNK